MNWWQRIGFSIVSLCFGWISFDFVLLALRYMHVTSGNQSKDVLFRFFLGCGILIFFLLLLALYFWLIRRISGNLNIIEYENPEEKPKIRSKWFDTVLQGGVLATGFFLRFAFIMVIYLPGV